MGGKGVPFPVPGPNLALSPVPSLKKWHFLVPDHKNDNSQFSPKNVAINMFQRQILNECFYCQCPKNNIGHIAFPFSEVVSYRPAHDVRDTEEVPKHCLVSRRRFYFFILLFSLFSFFGWGAGSVSEYDHMHKKVFHIGEWEGGEQSL